MMLNNASNLSIFPTGEIVMFKINQKSFIISVVTLLIVVITSSIIFHTFIITSNPPKINKII